MSKEGSVAPKERVNIVYRPAEAEGGEDVELPMKMLVLGDFAGGAQDRPIGDRQPVSIDKDNFDEVMKAQNVSLSFTVPNRLSEVGEEEIRLDLCFESLSDFSPDGLIQQVPELRRLLELREALRALKGPLANVAEFRRRIEEITTDDTARAKLLIELGRGENQGGSDG